MQQGHGAGAGLGDGAGAVRRLAGRRTQPPAQAMALRVSGDRPACCQVARMDARAAALAAGFWAPSIQPAPIWAVSARALGPVAAMATGRSSAGVDEAEVGAEQADEAALAFHLRLHRFAAPQGLDHADIFRHVRQFHRAKAHGAAAGEAGADAEMDAAGGELVERGEGVGGDGGDAVGRDEDAGAEMDARGLHGAGGHGDERVRAEHLRVVEPGMVEAEFLRPPDQAPGIRGGGNGDAEFHGVCSVDAVGGFCMFPPASPGMAGESIAGGNGPTAARRLVSRGHGELAERVGFEPTVRY